MGLHALVYKKDPPMYIDSDDGTGKKKLHMDMPSNKEFDGLSIGDRVKVNISGTVQELEGPREVPDYDYEPKRGEKRRMKKHPGSICINLDSDPDMDAIQEINASLMSEEG